MPQEINRHWSGYLTPENLERVATVMKEILEGQYYTVVTTSSQRTWPDVRLNQSLNEKEGIYHYYGNESQSWGTIGISDSYGAYTINMDNDPEHSAYIAFEYNKIRVEQTSSSGAEIRWQFVVEHHE